MCGRNNQYQLVLEKTLGLHVAAARRAFDEAENDLLLHHCLHNLLGVAADQRGKHARMLHAELAQQPRKHILGNRGRRAQREPTRMIAVQGGYPILGFGQHIARSARMFEQNPASRGQLCLGARAIKKLHAKVLFESLDLQAYRRLCEIQLLGSLPEAGLLRDRAKDHQPKVVKTSHCIIKSFAASSRTALAWKSPSHSFTNIGWSSCMAVLDSGGRQ